MRDDGKVPIEKIAEKAEEYKPSERVTYKMIKEYVESKYSLYRRSKKEFGVAYV